MRVLAKLEQGQRTAGRGQTKPALGSLKAFANEVRAAVKARRLTAQTGGLLLSEAAGLSAALSAAGG